MSDPFAPGQRPAGPPAADPQHDTLIVPMPAGATRGWSAPPLDAGASAPAPTSTGRSTWRQPAVWAVVAAALAGGVVLGVGASRVGEPAAPESAVAGAGSAESGVPGLPGLPDDAVPTDPDRPEGADGGLGDALRQGLADELGTRIREQVPGDLGESLGDLVEDPAVGEQVQQLLEDLITGGGEQG